MDNIKPLEWRYATKKFNAEKIIPQEKIEILKKSFNLTPTSYGLQPLKLVILSNKKLQEELLAASAHQHQISTASHVLVFCIETHIDDHFIEANFSRIKEIRNTPEEILNPFKDFLLNSFRKKTTAEINAWASKQVYLAMGNLLNVCASEKIDACPMEGFDNEAYDKILKLHEKGLKSVLLLPIGYRAKDDIFADFKKVRRPLNDVIVEI